MNLERIGKLNLDWKKMKNLIKVKVIEFTQYTPVNDLVPGTSGV